MTRVLCQLVATCAAVSVLMAQEPSKPEPGKAGAQKRQEAGKTTKKSPQPKIDQQSPKESKGKKGEKVPKRDKRIRLLTRGDDFGSTHAGNLALEEAFEESIMMSAGVMVPGPWFLETVAIVRNHPEWCIGVHLTLNSDWAYFRWGPVAPISEVPSLVGPDGNFYWNNWQTGDYLVVSLPGHVRTDYIPILTMEQPEPDEVERELRAQIKMAQNNGVRIDYLDCHMRTACTGELLAIVKKLAKELCVPIPEEGLLGEHRIRVSWDRETVESAKEGLEKKLLSLTPGLWKLIAYPAYDTPELTGVDPVWGARQATENLAMFEAWKDPRIREIIAEQGIELVSVRDLWDYEKCEPR